MNDFVSKPQLAKPIRALSRQISRWELSRQISRWDLSRQISRRKYIEQSDEISDTRRSLVQQIANFLQITHLSPNSVQNSLFTVAPTSSSSSTAENIFLWKSAFPGRGHPIARCGCNFASVSTSMTTVVGSPAADNRILSTSVCIESSRRRMVSFSYLVVRYSQPQQALTNTRAITEHAGVTVPPPAAGNDEDCRPWQRQMQLMRSSRQDLCDGVRPAAVAASVEGGRTPSICRPSTKQSTSVMVLVVGEVFVIFAVGRSCTAPLDMLGERGM